jgi:RNA recognition motif-containing protein
MSVRLHVGNLSAATTEETLRALFASDGRHVERIAVMTDRETGLPRGFCLVQLASPEEANAAIAAVNGREVDGKQLQVREARSRKDRERP